MKDSVSYPVRRSISERHYYETGVLFLGFAFQGFFHHQWRWIVFFTWILLMFIYMFLDRYIPRKLIISESQIQIGRVKVHPSELDRIFIFPDEHRISMESPMDDRDIRNTHRHKIRIRPIERDQALYYEIETWAKNNQINVKFGRQA